MRKRLDGTGRPRPKPPRDSGILLHCVGKEGGAQGAWMESIECQIIEGGVGDFIMVKGKTQPKITVEAEKRTGGTYYKPGAPPIEATGRVNWYDRDPGLKKRGDVEKPLGEWNRLECICDGDKITLVLNGKVVNAATKASHTKGKIMFQSEGAEIFFRKIDMKALQ